jgi:predicted anti-sigma-YlaC factor YlaD
VDCDTCREALSARLDGEPEPASPDEHLNSCRECQDWEAAATAVFRDFTAEAPYPDVAAAVLGRVEPRTGLLGSTRWRPKRLG